MMMQIEYSRLSWLTTNFNIIRSELNAGGIIQYPLMQIPPNPFGGGNIAFNNINVNQSTIGALNTGTISNLDLAITLMKSQGENELAEVVKELTEAVIKSNEINDSTKNEINEQLEFLVAQATADAKNRSIGTVKSVLTGIKDSVSTVAGLLTIWNSLEPLIKATLGIS